MKQNNLTKILDKGPSTKYVTLFYANFDSPCHTLSHIPGPPKVRHTSRPPPIFVGLVQKALTKAPCTNSLSIVRWGFCPGVLSGRFCPSPHLSECMCYNRKLNFTWNVMFHMYKKMYRRDVTSSWSPPPVTNCHTFSDPSPLELDVLYGRPLTAWPIHRQH